MKEASGRPPFVFMHVPKTSGSALVASVVATGRGHVVQGFDRTTFGGFDDWASLAPDIRSTVALTPADLPRHALMESGHYALSTLRAAFPHAPVLTILRDPTARSLSLWLYWRGLDDGALAPWGSWAERLRIAREPLERFLSDERLASQLDNVVLRLLLCPHPLIPRDHFIDRRHDLRLLRQARRILRRFDFVDLVENPRIERNLASWLDWPWHRPVVNATGQVPPAAASVLHEEFTPEAVRLLRERGRLDQVLWADVARRKMGGGEAAILARDRAWLVATARYGALANARGGGAIWTSISGH